MGKNQNLYTRKHKIFTFTAKYTNINKTHATNRVSIHYAEK